MFTVLPTKDRKKLEIIQNRAARLIFCAGRRTHTTPLLQELHWLPLQKRISYKLCLYVYKILQHSAPTYLEDMISVYTPTRTLRSMSDKTLLTIPRSALVVGDKSFSVSASRQWNSLPLSLRECHSLDTFKKHLKTFFFLCNVLKYECLCKIITCKIRNYNKENVIIRADIWSIILLEYAKLFLRSLYIKWR